MEATSLMNHLVSPLSSHSSLSQPSTHHFLLPSSSSSLPAHQRKISSSRIYVSNPRSRLHLLDSKTKSKFITRCSVNGTENTGKDIPIEKQFSAFPTVMDINQVRDILPHRFPFLLVDRVIEYNAGVSAVAIKNVTINDNFFPGHFPERPTMHGILMIEVTILSCLRSSVEP